jgi:hypothetical protein
MIVKYTINNGQPLEFYVPAREQEMRWATYSVSNYLLASVSVNDTHLAYSVMALARVLIQTTFEVLVLKVATIRCG